MRELGVEGVKILVYNHTASVWKNWPPNCGLPPRLNAASCLNLCHLCCKITVGLLLQVTSLVYGSVRPRRRQPTRLPRPWDSPGRNSGVGCRFLLQCMKVKSESEVAQSRRLFATPWTAACQAPPSVGFSRQEHWNGLPSPSPQEHWSGLPSPSPQEHWSGLPSPSPTTGLPS